MDISKSMKSIVRPKVQAHDGNGKEYFREAASICDLPTPEDRLAALWTATATIATRLGRVAEHRIPFGGYVYSPFMTRPEAKKHELSELLLTGGNDLSLDFCPEYD
jgi:hypothetical protein